MFRLNVDYPAGRDTLRINIIVGNRYNLYDVLLNGHRACRLKRTSTLRVGLYNAVSKQLARIQEKHGDVSKHQRVLTALGELRNQA